MKKELSAGHPVVARKIDRNLRGSVREGMFASVSTGLGLSYLSPFALALNATASQIGILHAVINLVPSFIQLKGACLLEKFSRKKIMMRGILLKVLIWVPIILMGLYFSRGYPYAVWILIVLATLLYGVGAMVHPAWFSWIGSLVPENERGKYFSKRNRMIGMMSIITMIVGAVVLDRAEKMGYILIGFGILFFVAAVMRFITYLYFVKSYDPKLHVRKKDHFSFSYFMKNITKTGFGRFVLFRGVMSFAIGIAGPFWAVYMLRDLGFSYLWFMVITVSEIAYQLMFLPVTGKISDRFGNVALMRLAAWSFVSFPLLWVFSSYLFSGIWFKLFVLFVPAVISGFAIAAYNIAVNNYVYDAVKVRKRAYGVSYMNLFVGVGVFLGSSFGALLAYIGVSFMNTMLFIFFVSGVLRIFVAFFGTKYLKEVRHVKKFSSEFLVKELMPYEAHARHVHYHKYNVKKEEHYV